MRIYAAASVLVFALLSGCTGGVSAPNDPGPAPGADHQEQVRERVGRLLQENIEHKGTATNFRFAEPVLDNIPRWHFDPEIEGQPYQFGIISGWRVDFYFTPQYVGFPQQPERHEMAFFGNGKLRGIFGEGCGNAPFGLDKWDASWVDESWRPLAEHDSKKARATP